MTFPLDVARVGAAGVALSEMAIAAANEQLDLFPLGLLGAGGGGVFL